MTNNKKRHNEKSNAQKGKPFSEAQGVNNTMAAEDMEKANHPTGGQNTPQ
ncbi:hypothetical protein [Lottiidibacillus patelloidae]|nr:hypothetical protein [Lottiidibacillus patelloidae]